MPLSITLEKIHRSKIYDTENKCSRLKRILTLSHKKALAIIKIINPMVPTIFLIFDIGLYCREVMRNTHRIMLSIPVAMYSQTV